MFGAIVLPLRDAGLLPLVDDSQQSFFGYFLTVISRHSLSTKQYKKVEHQPINSNKQLNLNTTSEHTQGLISASTNAVTVIFPKNEHGNNVNRNWISFLTKR